MEKVNNICLPFYILNYPLLLKNEVNLFSFYKKDEFADFLSVKKGQEEIDLDNWTMDELKTLVQEFFEYHKEVEEKKEKEKENVNQIQQQSNNVKDDPLDNSNFPQNNMNNSNSFNYNIISNVNYGQNIINM